MTILGIETSCDETGIGVVKKDTQGTLRIVTNSLASSLALHAKTGGIIPESAAREQVKYIIPLLENVLTKTTWKNIDAIAVTVGPGLIGSLLVGVETAKALALLYDKPLIPVNHMHGHVYANWLYQKADITFPALALVVSGGHTDLLLMKNEKNIEVLGGTRDDAAGEAFDKIGRLLDLPYPAGPIISKLAEKGNPKAFNLPRPMIGSKDFDFSFSGLKTSVLTLTKKQSFSGQAKNDLCASVQEAIVSVLVKKTIRAAEKFRTQSILLGGGVAANTALKDRLAMESLKLGASLFAPEKELCTDNGLMIAAAGFFQHNPQPWQNITAKPEMYYETPLASMW